MPKFILCRHGETAYNLAKRYQGNIDIPLNETGQAQAEALRSRLGSVKFDAVYTSDLQRAVQTAQTVLSSHPSGLQPETTPLLREIDGGVFEGLSWEEINSQFPEEVALWQQDRTNNAPPRGENLTQVRTRLEKVLAQMVAAYPGEDQTILLVVHGGVIGILLCHLMGMDLNHLWKWRIDNCSVTTLDIYKDGAILSLFNDIQHLKVTER